MGRKSAGKKGGGEGQGEAEGGGIADCSPGTIVWVRRRNGSWWPGRILGPDDLPASQVVSPRTGTPVKLLGREDASIDWYNLEKSKRVKEFRCGDFDACIQKAKSFQGTAVKRREKYARREDAILHALRLERKELALKYGDQGFSADDMCSIPFAVTGRDFDNSASEYYSRNNVQQPQSQLQSSAAQECKDLSTTRYKSKTSKKREGDNSVLLGKTKECKQKFIHTGSKTNLSGSLALEAPEKTLNDYVSASSYLEHTLQGSNVENGVNNATLKKKRSEEVVFKESLVKKHDRCRPLAQVVQSNVKLPLSLQCNDESDTLIEGGKDPLPAICQSKRSRATYLSGGSGDTHSHGDTPALQTILPDSRCVTESYLKQPDSFSREQIFPDFVEKHESDFSVSGCSETETEDDTELLQKYAKRQSPDSDTRDPNSIQASNKTRHVNDNDDDDEATISTYIPQQNVLDDEDGSSELGVSQWHMKGKRNQRSAAKRPMGKCDRNLSSDISNCFMKGSLKMINEDDPKMESIGTYSHQSFGQSFSENKADLDCDSYETNLVDKSVSHSELNRFNGNDYSSSLKSTRDHARSYASFNDTEISCETSPINKHGDHIYSLGRKTYREASFPYQQNYSSHLGYLGPMLFNVDLKVQASYQGGEHVPLVSLRSRLNVKAIVGHPIQIEVLEEGSTDHLVLASDIVLGHSTASAPAWRTGRRTAMPRVPRSNSSRAALHSDDGVALWEVKPTFGRFAKKKSQKKPSDLKKGSSPSQKIRVLSSISIGKKHYRGGSQANAHRVRDLLGGLIKSEGAIPLVTCVPAKVVFSRIMEAVGRPSHALSHRVRKTSPVIRDSP